MLCIYVQSAFAAFRHFSAGSFRQTADFITPSAAYGLLLNAAGIEMRSYKSELPMTAIKENLPCFKMALGARELPIKHSLFQQLHNYPVGSSGKEKKAGTKGSKYNIAPARRAILSGIKGYICIDENPDFEEQLKMGLEGKTKRGYGLPFLGDNSFLLDRFEITELPDKAYWFVRVIEKEKGMHAGDITRLSIKINREDMSKTETELFMPKHLEGNIPEEAWVEVGY